MPAVEMAAGGRWYRGVRGLLRLLYMAAFRIDVSGRHHVPTDGPAVICANHISAWDPPLVGIVLERPVQFMAKRELFAYPVLGPVLRRIGTFPVNRGSADRRALRRAVGVLRSGGLMGLFPEGSRNTEPRLAPAHRGVELIARMGEAPVVPTGIRADYTAGGQVQVRFGEPFLINGEGRAGERAGRHELMTRIARLSGKLPPEDAASGDIEEMQRRIEQE